MHMERASSRIPTCATNLKLQGTIEFILLLESVELMANWAYYIFISSVESKESSTTMTTIIKFRINTRINIGRMLLFKSILADIWNLDANV
uniref:Uncharacterized protein n=1 Tax=Romanomermis culicivorax TaxID=13658 RepID=A0A915J2F7_ROMCU